MDVIFLVVSVVEGDPPGLLINIMSLDTEATVGLVLFVINNSSDFLHKQEDICLEVFIFILAV